MTPRPDVDEAFVQAVLAEFFIEGDLARLPDGRFRLVTDNGRLRDIAATLVVECGWMAAVMPLVGRVGVVWFEVPGAPSRN